jgi:hypothetical protein
MLNDSIYKLCDITQQSNKDTSHCRVGAVSNEAHLCNNVFSSDPNTNTHLGFTSICEDDQQEAESLAETSPAGFPVRYDINKKALIGGQGSKVRKLLKLKLVEMLSATHFLIHPIEGYNSTTYQVVISIEEESCNCQYNKIYGKTCSHILASKAYFNIMTGGAKDDTKL